MLEALLCTIPKLIQAKASLFSMADKRKATFFLNAELSQSIIILKS